MKNITRSEDLPLYLTVEEIRDVLHISRTRAYEIIHADDFPAIWLGRRCVIPRDRFLAWLDACASVDRRN